jgi:hypothetical protein
VQSMCEHCSPPVYCTHPTQMCHTPRTHTHGEHIHSVYVCTPAQLSTRLMVIIIVGKVCV